MHGVMRIDALSESQCRPDRLNDLLQHCGDWMAFVSIKIYSETLGVRLRSDLMEPFKIISEMERVNKEES